MTTTLLLQAIKSYLEQLLAGDVTTVPAIHLLKVPDKRKENVGEIQVPYIILHPSQGKQDDEAQITVTMVFGVLDKSDEGGLTVINLMERVRIALLRQRIVDRKYRIETPYEWEFFTDQPLPYWEGMAKTIWTVPAIQEEVTY